jgi:hypothetical protein
VIVKDILQRNLPAIDPKKVLIVRNTSRSESLEMADYYCEARGLEKNYVDLPLGTGTGNITDGGRFFFLQDVRNNIISKKIECVLLSSHSPKHFQPANTDSSVTITADSMFGAAVYAVNAGAASFPGTTGLNLGEYHPEITHYNTAYPEPGVLFFSSPYSRYSAPVYPGYFSSIPMAPDDTGRSFVGFARGDWPGIISNRYLLPFGRIGLPKWNGSVPNESTAETMRMIDDAILSESIGFKGKSVAIGVHNRIDHMRQHWQWYAYEMMRSFGMAANYYVRSWGNSHYSWFGKQPDWDFSSVSAGTAAVNAYGYLGGAIMNEAIGSAAYSSFNPDLGAFCYEATSTSSNMGASIIMRGGCAAIGGDLEPFANKIADVASVAWLLVGGFSMAEVNWFSSSSPWRTSVFGDPLYRPFLHKGLDSGDSYGIVDITKARAATSIPKQMDATLIHKERAIQNITPSRQVSN